MAPQIIQSALQEYAFSIPETVYATGILILCWRLLQKPFGSAAYLKKGEAANFEPGGNGVDQVAIKKDPAVDPQSRIGKLAVIIPARNEAVNLPGLLKSLVPLKDQGARILVVDDQSTDGTAEVAKRFSAEVYQTSEKPDGWSGKNWACAQGAEYLKKMNFNGEYLLFTDADTVHNPENLQSALWSFENEKAALMTAKPFHRNPSFWEKLLGPFHLMVLLITNAMQNRPSSSRFFSIGQFLLFRKSYYYESGGHTQVKAELAEDLALAQVCFHSQKKFLVYPKTDLYSTRMYATLKDFFKGWQRNFRLGMRQSNLQVWAEILLVMAAVMGSWNWFSYALASAIFILFQHKQGSFSMLGAIFYPVGLLLFIVISLFASISSFRNKPIVWKSREYSVTKTVLLIFTFLFILPRSGVAAATDTNAVITNGSKATIFAKAANSLKITVEGLKSNAGGVELTLFNQTNEKDYPVHPQNAVAQQYKLLDGKNVAEFVFNNLPAGEYAAFAYHDEDSDKKIGTNLMGIPTEGYGATQGAKNNFGPPKFKDAKFLVGGTHGADSQVTIKIEY